MLLYRAMARARRALGLEVVKEKNGDSGTRAGPPVVTERGSGQSGRCPSPWASASEKAQASSATAVARIDPIPALGECSGAVAVGTAASRIETRAEPSRLRGMSLRRKAAAAGPLVPRESPRLRPDRAAHVLRIAVSRFRGVSPLRFELHGGGLGVEPAPRPRAQAGHQPSGHGEGARQGRGLRPAPDHGPPGGAVRTRGHQQG